MLPEIVPSSGFGWMPGSAKISEPVAFTEIETRRVFASAACTAFNAFGTGATALHLWRERKQRIREHGRDRHLLAARAGA